MSAVRNCLTIDVEEWFHICGVGGLLAPSNWNRLPSRVVETTEIVAQPRTPLPAVIIDKQAPADLNPDLVAEGVGIVSIGSVYDVMDAYRARLAHVHERVFYPACTQPFYDAIGDVTLADSVQRNRHSPAREANALR